jgi:drug/metabolite transporter (DMT)-like permease
MTIEFTPLFCYAIAFVAVFISTAGQILLKKQANDTVGKKGFIWKFLNLRVILAYGSLFLSLALNQIALKQVPVSVLPCITSTSFIWIFLFGFFILKEKPSKKKLIGVALILLGNAVSRL